MMIEQSLHIAGLDRQILTAQTANDTKALGKLITPDRPWAFDVETNAYPIYHPSFRVRLIQLGDMETACVFPVEQRNLGIGVIRKAFKELPELLAHVAKYDMQSLAQHGAIAKLSDLETRFVDTRLLTHLLDPRGKKDGGIGHKLVEVAAHYVDESAADSDKELMKRFKELGHKTKELGYRHIPLFDPIFTLYAGADVLLTALLYDVVMPLVAGQQS